MLTRRKLVVIGLMGMALLTGCQSPSDSQVEIKMISEEEQTEILNTYTFEDYRRVFDEAISESSQFDDQDDQLNKWIIRTLAQEKLYYETDLTKEEVVEVSNQAMEEDRVWKSIAENDYGVKVSDEEIDQFITEGPDKSDVPQHLAYAEALGFSLKELNHNYDRDLYEKNVLWMKLKPKLEKKYGVLSNNELIKKYEAEVANKVNQSQK
ncbi:hypothetical protein [Pontibacillus salipaludis]|uniref:SurA-like protein n=1 Tax=Pontibacillus salipaludis TaxID=1697394 RepID=A0ABQ1Q543_9BACI|nr:hypothetical protein [Pontibacillus salipaludis]GGD12560.1 hypothetical protein GCM10011389_20160 [Pontibacillus salipaludis]